MASSDNLMTVEPPSWVFRSTFNDSWFPDMFTRETETLTKVLSKSFSNQAPDFLPTVQISPQPFQTTSTVSGPTVSGGSENETAVSKQRRSGNVNGVGKKITKRKPRASKRACTTYITADVDSFRQMVQQVTGVRMSGDGHVAVGSVLKPEARRPVDRVQQVNCLPTLDTSAFLLDPTPSYMAPLPLSAGQPPSAVVPDGGAGGFGFDSFYHFPTLESCERNVML